MSADKRTLAKTRRETLAQEFQRLTAEMEADGSLARERLKLEVAEAIYLELKSQKISQGELARRVGVSQPVVSVWLNGENVTLETLAKIGHALSCEWVLTLKKREKKKRK